MGAKPRSTTSGETMSSLERSAPAPAADTKPTRWRGGVVRRSVALTVVAVGAAAAIYIGYGWYKNFELSRTVRRLFAERHYSAASEPLRLWLARQPASGEAQYYRAWEALALDRPQDVASAIEQAGKLGFDPARSACLTAIYFARGGRYDKAEPILTQAFMQGIEPRDLVAKELGRIYLSSFRLPQAAQAIERWRALAPDDPLPYLWRNQVAARFEVEPHIEMMNYRSALERDPNLDEARLGLAQQLSKARRFDEAERVYREYLKRKPDDASALIGLGRDAFQSGDLSGATRHFEAALAASPQHRDALKELGLIELRLGQFQKACERFALLTKMDPYDYEIRYSHAKALELVGDQARSRVEFAQASRLRDENEEMLKFRYNLFKNPSDLDSRFHVARWLLEHGHHEEGLKWTAEILRADPRHVPTHRILADYFRNKGDAGLANYHVLMSMGTDK
jgi:tetratricopeptide (TPR) repeat protein